MTEKQFDNPSAPDYDWQRDREWFNQRLASANIRNHNLARRLSDAMCVLRVIADGAKGAKRLAAQAVEADKRAKLEVTTNG